MPPTQRRTGKMRRCTPVIRRRRNERAKTKNYILQLSKQEVDSGLKLLPNWRSDLDDVDTG
jgi:hypothetical protein